MHSHSLEHWQHSHNFLGEQHRQHERRVWMVVAVTAAMMVAEIIGGAVYGSMALMADGWHMATHAGALAIAAAAYRYARKHANDPRFTLGTGKLGELAGFTSAIILGVIAVLIAYESTMRVLSPVAIRFNEAIAIAAVGLLVNVVSAWLLQIDSTSHGHHKHNHSHGHGHNHHHAGDDTNMRAAYAHVLADALTSVLAIAALVAGRFAGWNWLDPVVGLLGAVMIASWSWSLVKTSGAVLLDTIPVEANADLIRRSLEAGTDRVSDLHLWRLGPGHLALMAVVVSDEPLPPDAYKARLATIPMLSHITIEVQACRH
jgi:cation diffusion facilitator family transporter